MSVNNNIKIENSSLYEIDSLNTLMLLLGIHGEDELCKLCSVENYNIYYTGPKKRLVEAPYKRLKLIQKKFNNYLQKIETPEYVFAGRKKTSNILNAKVHIDCNDMMCADIKKFFPSTNIIYVKQFLIKYLKMTEEVANILSKILTVNNHLPTGAPSSVLLTYWSYKDTFDAIHVFAENIGIKMTIYVDDMTFSAKSKISRLLTPFVDKKLSSVGLTLHPEKIKRYKCSKYKHSTGVCIDKRHQMRIPNKTRKKLIDLIEGKNICDLTTQELEKGISSIKYMQGIEPKAFQHTLEKMKEEYKLRPKSEKMKKHRNKRYLYN